MADGPRRLTTERPPRAIDTYDRAIGTGSGSITTLRDTMRVQDVERTRAFARLAALLCLAVTAPLPFVGGDPVVKALFACSMVVTALSCLRLDYKLRDPSEYNMRDVLQVAYVCMFGAFCGIGYWGVFSPAPVVIPFGLYFFGLAHSFRGTLIVYICCGVSYAVLAGLVGLNVIAARGLLQPASISPIEVFVVIVVVEVVFLATYLIARFSRRATENAIADHDRAVREIAGRDALLQEARMDLDGVLRARGLGRFTDEVLGDYQLGELLGRGGMGEVYDAIHVDSEEPAAVKLLHPHVLDDAVSVKRFLRECEIASSMEVANVVKVIAVSPPGAPVPFIAMERLHGQDLADYLRAHGRMRMREVVRLLREVGAGLDAARDADVVHRDIKPRNLFHAERHPGQKPIWKILDFGVSKLMGEATMTGHHVVGTPSYMAPEQATGGEVTHLTDLYALGVITYRCLSGRPAFSGDSPPAILYQVVNEMPPRPSDTSGRITPQVDQVLAIAMAKDPRNRFSSASELADALERAAKGRLSAALRGRAERLLTDNPWG